MSIDKSIVFVMGLSILLGSVSIGMQYQPTPTDNARWNQLADAAATGNAQLFDQILQQDQRFSPNYFDGNGNGVVHIAALNGHIDVINAIIKNNQTPGRTGITFTGKNKDGDTPMHLAIKLRRWDIASKIALDCPSVSYWSIKNKDGETPIGSAIETDGFGWLVPLALSKEDPTYWRYSGIFDKDKNGNTIVHKAVARGYITRDIVIHFVRKYPEQFYIRGQFDLAPIMDLTGRHWVEDIKSLILNLIKECPVPILTAVNYHNESMVTNLFEKSSQSHETSWREVYEFLYNGLKNRTLDAGITDRAVYQLCDNVFAARNPNDRDHIIRFSELLDMVLSKHPEYTNIFHYNLSPFARCCLHCDEPDFALILLKFGANLDDAENAARNYNRQNTLALIAEWKQVLTKLNKTQNDLQTSPELREQAVTELTKLRQENDNNNDN